MVICLFAPGFIYRPSRALLCIARDPLPQVPYWILLCLTQGRHLRRLKVVGMRPWFSSQTYLLRDLSFHSISPASVVPVLLVGHQGLAPPEGPWGPCLPSLSLQPAGACFQDASLSSGFSALAPLSLWLPWVFDAGMGFLWLCCVGFSCGVRTPEHTGSGVVVCGLTCLVACGTSLL